MRNIIYYSQLLLRPCFTLWFIRHCHFNLRLFLESLNSLFTISVTDYWIPVFLLSYMCILWRYYWNVYSISCSVIGILMLKFLLMYSSQFSCQWHRSKGKYSWFIWDKSEIDFRYSILSIFFVILYISCDEN